MINSPNNQLDEFIKETLKNHEVPFNEAHWNEFESKLNSKPSVSVMSNKWRYSLNIFLGFILAGSASVFIYNKLSSPSTVTTTTNATQNTISKTSVQNVKDNNSSNANSANSVIDEYNAAQKNNPVVINNISDNNTYSVFTSADISNSPSSAATTIGVNSNNIKPIGYSVITNTNTNPISSTIPNVTDANNSDKIDPLEIQKQLDLAKTENTGRAVFPDMLDKHAGAIYPTKESDTVKSKAEKDVQHFFLNGQNGNPNSDAVKSFIDKTEKKR